MTTNSSCELPKMEPFFAATPTTRKCTPSISNQLVERIDRGRTARSAVSQPMHRDRAVRCRLRLGSSGGHASASNVREVDVFL